MPFTPHRPAREGCIVNLISLLGCFTAAGLHVVPNMLIVVRFEAHIYKPRTVWELTARMLLFNRN